MARQVKNKKVKHLLLSVGIHSMLNATELLCSVGFMDDWFFTIPDNIKELYIRCTFFLLFLSILYFGSKKEKKKICGNV